MIRSVLADRNGGVGVAVALTLTAVIGAGAFAIDLGYQSLNGTVLQNAADAAALAAVQHVRDPVRSVAEAVEFARANVPAGYGTVTTANDVAIGHFDADRGTFTPGLMPFNAVRVTTVRSTARGNGVARFLAGVLGQGPGEVQRTAIASVEVGREACVIALDPSSSETFRSSGRAEVRVPSCGIGVNSNAAVALYNRGPGGIQARSIDVVGGFSGVNINPTPLVGQRPFRDPLAHRTQPSTTNRCDFINRSFKDNRGETVFPAETVFCGNIEIDGRVRFSPGVHHFREANVVLRSNALALGEGVTLYFDRDSCFDSAGAGSVRLTAPTSGPTAGIAIWASRNSPTPGAKHCAGRNGLAMQTFRFRGAKDYFVGGSIYLPMQRAEFIGNADLDVSFQDNADLGYVIAQRLSFSGSARFTFDLHGHFNAIMPSGVGTRYALVQ